MKYFKFIFGQINTNSCEKLHRIDINQYLAKIAKILKAKFVELLRNI